MCGGHVGVLACAGVAFAGRPLAIDDADPVDVGQFEFEAGAAYERDSGYKHWDMPFGLAYGVAPNVEAGVGFGGQFERRMEALDDAGAEVSRRESSIGDLTLGAKWRFIDSCPLGARHALAASVKFPTADEDKGFGSGETDYDLSWIASRSLGESASAHLNVGYSWIGGPDEDVFHYGVALDYQALDAVQWVGEVFAERETTGGADTVVQYNTGFRWTPVESLMIDIAGGSKLKGDAPDFIATAGLTWTFGFDAKNE
ncbi:MAG: transporter [Kiritimatiellae bacterium]|nr:transporter [Kiritimatiellia bacterium]